jgi:regulator of protease activity HflC (stomatin/prohibitin superfamily)
MTFSTIVTLVFALLVLSAIAGGITIVRQSHTALVERLGKYSRTLEPGLHLIIPFIERVVKRVPIFERQIGGDNFTAITHDNVQIQIKVAILFRVVDAARFTYRIEGPDDRKGLSLLHGAGGPSRVNSAIDTIVQGTVRSLIGKTDLDGVQSNRAQLSQEIETELETVSSEWGIVLTRVEITEVEVGDTETLDIMKKQLNAERQRRADILEAEGRKQATLLDAEGQKLAVQLAADARLYAAQREGEAKRVLAEAEAFALNALSAAVQSGGSAAVEFEIRKLQAGAMKEIAQGGNSKIVVLPTDVLAGVAGALGRLGGRS